MGGFFLFCRLTKEAGEQGEGGREKDTEISLPQELESNYIHVWGFPPAPRPLPLFLFFTRHAA